MSYEDGAGMCMDGFFAWRIEMFFYFQWKFACWQKWTISPLRQYSGAYKHMRYDNGNSAMFIPPLYNEGRPECWDG